MTMHNPVKGKSPGGHIRQVVGLGNAVLYSASEKLVVYIPLEVNELHAEHLQSLQYTIIMLHCIAIAHYYIYNITVGNRKSACI
jgi:hypothetical protein